MTASPSRKLRWHEFGTPDELAEAMARRIARSLNEAIETRGRAILAVSGGRTPKRLFEALAFAPIAWDKVTITLVDERFVAPGDERSNERLVRSHLMRYRAGKAEFVPLFRPATTLEDAAALADAAISAMPLPLDVTVLGMGPDGHTASFFPDADNLAALYANAAGRAVLPVVAASAGEPRLTLSMQVIAASRLTLVHIEGPERKTILTGAVAENRLPIARILAETATTPQIYWAP